MSAAKKELRLMVKQMEQQAATLLQTAREVQERLDEEERLADGQVGEPGRKRRSPAKPDGPVSETERQAARAALSKKKGLVLLPCPTK